MRQSQKIVLLRFLAELAFPCPFIYYWRANPQKVSDQNVLEKSMDEKKPAHIGQCLARFISPSRFHWVTARQDRQCNDKTTLISCQVFCWNRRKPCKQEGLHHHNKHTTSTFVLTKKSRLQAIGKPFAILQKQRSCKSKEAKATHK